MIELRWRRGEGAQRLHYILFASPLDTTAKSCSCIATAAPSTVHISAAIYKELKKQDSTLKFQMIDEAAEFEMIGAAPHRHGGRATYLVAGLRNFCQARCHELSSLSFGISSA